MLDNLNALLEDQIKDLYSAENQLLKALPKMAKTASNEMLREAFEAHLEETKVHVERLQEIAKLLEITPGGKKCKAMEGLLEEGKEALEEEGEDAIIDAGLIVAAQKVEHYEISGYGSASAIAEQLNESEIVELLQMTLQEEEATDEKLSDISINQILPSATSSDEDGEDGDEGENDNGDKSRDKARSKGRDEGDNSQESQSKKSTTTTRKKSSSK